MRSNIEITAVFS